MAEDKPRLLIVEDDPGLQKQLKWCFDEYEVIAATDRPAALAALRAEREAVIRRWQQSAPCMVQALLDERWRGLLPED